MSRQKPTDRPVNYCSVVPRRMFIIVSFPCQGALDIQFLTARFERGKAEVQDYMTRKHRYVNFAAFSDSHADLLQWHADQSDTNTPFLGLQHDDQHSAHKQYPQKL